MKKFGSRYLLVIISLGIIFWNNSIEAGQEPEKNTSTSMVPITEFYEYDKNLPLNFTEELLEETPVYEKYELYFDSVNNERVPALFYLPKGEEPPFACIIIGVGFGGDKENTEMLYKFFLLRYYAILVIDPQYQGERAKGRKTILANKWYETRNAFIQTVIDLRRGVDYLEKRGDIDSERIGFMGLSLGTVMGAIFIGVEPRIKTAVLVIGGGDWREFFKHSRVPTFALLRELSDEATMESIVEKMSPIDGINFIGRFSPRPLLMLNVKNDITVPAESGKALFEAAKQPKKIQWLDSPGHLPNFDLVEKRADEWFSEYLPPFEEVSEIRIPKIVEQGKLKIDGEVIAEPIEEGMTTIFIKAWFSPALKEGIVVEAYFPNLDYNIPLFDNGLRGDASKGDGIFSLSLSLPEIKAMPDGFDPSHYYQLNVRVKNTRGEILNSKYLGIAFPVAKQTGESR